MADNDQAELLDDSLFTETVTTIDGPEPLWWKFIPGLGGSLYDLPTIWTETDFQYKLLIGLLLWLALNLCLIRFAWKKYGDKLAEMLMTDTSTKDNDEYKNRFQTEDTLHYKFTDKIHRE